MRRGLLGARGMLLVSALLPIVSCTPGWVRPNTTAQKAAYDEEACLISAWRKYPTNLVHIPAENIHETSRDEDTNVLLRDIEEQYCMRQQGYSYQMVR